MMHKYEIIIYWSDEDDVFVAEVPELPGCAAHGDTPNAGTRVLLEAEPQRPRTCVTVPCASASVRTAISTRSL